MTTIAESTSTLKAQIADIRELKQQLLDMYDAMLETAQELNECLAEQYPHIAAEMRPYLNDLSQSVAQVHSVLQ
jgi:dsDNA-binding SOS-regulon protein